jgi:hypothetical protein
VAKGKGAFGLVDWKGGKKDDDKDPKKKDGKGGGGDDRDPKKPGHQGLRNSGLSAELKQNLENVMLAYQRQDDTIMAGYEDRLAQLGVSLKDSEKATDTQTFANLSNRGRERANALSEVMAQGGGESDVLRAQGMSLRNWNANQNEVNRSMADSLTSVNSSLTDLNTDTKSARVQAAQGMIADKGQLWSGYFDAKADAWTQLGNTYGQMAEYYGLADEQVGTKKRKKKQDKFSDKSGRAFMNAARVGSDSWDAPDIPGGVANWEGAGAFQNKLTNNGLSSMAAGPAMTRPEGATLRKWDA